MGSDFLLCLQVEVDSVPAFIGTIRLIEIVQNAGREGLLEFGLDGMFELFCDFLLNFIVHDGVYSLACDPQILGSVFINNARHTFVELLPSLLPEVFSKVVFYNF